MKKLSLGILDSRQLKIRNNLQENDDLSCSPSRSSKSLTCLRVPWLLKSLSSDQPAQWLNIRVFDPRPIQAVASSSITGVTVLCP